MSPRPRPPSPGFDAAPQAPAVLSLFDPAFYRPATWAGVLTVLLLLGHALPAAKFFAVPAHYLPFHTTLEMLAMAISGMVFALAWNLRHQPGQGHRLVLGTAFLAVCLIDLAHTLSFAGMPALLTPSDPEKAINFWLAGRLVAAMALLAVAWRPGWSVSAPWALATALAVAGGVWWVGLLHADSLPRTFISGQGLTPLKIGAEYLLALAYGAAAVRMALRGRDLGDREWLWLAAAAWVQGLAEMFFTLYADVTDVFNLLGHIYKAIAYLMIYRALFVAGVRQPQRELELERTRLWALLQAIPTPIWLKDLNGAYVSGNAAFASHYGIGPTEMVGRMDHDFVDVGLADAFAARDQEALRSEGPLVDEHWSLHPAGGRALFEVTKMAMRGPDGQAIGVLGVAYDITRQRATQHELRERIKEMNCVYDVFTLTEDVQAPLEPQLQAVADRLPAGWQYPDQACARVVAGGRRYLSPGFSETQLRQTAVIRTQDDDDAWLDLYYRPGHEPEPAFLPAEQQLLETVAARLASVMDQRRVRRDLREREAVFLAIASQAEDSITLIETQTFRFVEFNDAAARNLGYTRAEFGQLTIGDIEAAESAGDLQRHVLAQTPDAGATIESRHRRKDGEVRDVLLRFRALQLGGQPYLAAIWSDITERKLTETRLRESEQHFRNLANGGSTLIWTEDTERQRNYVNEPWMRFTGRSLAQERGNGWEDGLHPDDRAARRQALDRAWLQRLPVSLTYRLRHADGPYRWVRDDCNPRYDSQGSFLGYIGHCVDITRQKESDAELDRYRMHLESLVEARTSELAKAKEVAEAATIAKSSFLANMSHEIRTPLNAVVGMAHLIRRSGVTPQQAERLQKIDAAGEHLLGTINNILDLSKIEAGKFLLEQTELSVNALLANVASILSDKAHDKKLEFVTEARALPRHLVGDPTRLRQALVNYAANAIKFTETGRVTVRAMVEEETAHDVLLRFEVEDTGIGIPEAAQAKVFEAFEQVDSSTTRRFGGSGLGLALTRRIAQSMGGEAGLRSVEGTGSTFWFTARLRKGHSIGPAASASGPGMAEAALLLRHPGRRILLVEDEPVNREVTSFLLSDAGLLIEVAEDGEQALEKASRERYDLILMDMQMPRMDGLEATRRIRLTHHGEHVPVLSLTANAFMEDKARCLAAGMDDFITKPVDPDQLFGTVLKWLDQRRF